MFVPPVFPENAFIRISGCNLSFCSSRKSPGDKVDFYAHAAFLQDRYHVLIVAKHFFLPFVIDLAKFHELLNLRP